MPCLECPDGTFRWGEDGDCEYDTMEDCAAAHEGEEEAAVDEMLEPWYGLLAVVGEPTSDGRVFMAATWRTLPLPFSWQIESWPGHDGSVMVGRIDYVEQRGDEIWGGGVIDLGQEAGREVVRQRRNDMQRGVSIDAAVADGEVEYDEDTGLTTFSEIEIGGATIVSFPAFAKAEWRLGQEVAAAAEEPAPPAPSQPPAAAVAASAAWRPPRAWFADPKLDRRRGMHVEESGRIWGHIYGWGECHIGSPAGQCVQVPRHGDYSYIIGVDGRGVICDDGEHVQTGPLALAADHAELRGLTWLQAKDHYANTSLAVADVVVGEDSHGIWFAGAVRPGIDEDLVHCLRASGPSGDWRLVGGRLNLIAVLGVSVQGFPALAAAYSGGEITALVAHSSTASEDCGCGGHSDVTKLLARLDTIERHLFSERRRAEAAALLRLDPPKDMAARLLAAVE